ncbi:MAG: hypothetical protein GY723_01750 [bacterium]|nr:hypothetical protein [bacterium]
MIPYIEEPHLVLGPISLSGFGMLVCLAVVVGFKLVVHRAPRLGIDPEVAASVLTWTLVWGFVGSHVFDVIAYSPATVLRDPLELLRIWGSMSSFGGILSGLMAAWWVMHRRGMPLDQRVAFVELVGFAFPFAWIFGRMGCAFDHHHLGVESTHWLAVAFPDGPRFDMGLLEMLYTLCIAAVFALLNRRDRTPPFFLGLFFVLYGPVRFFLDTLRVGDARYLQLNWTPGQFLSLAVTLFGGWLLWYAYRRAAATPQA